MEQFCEPASDNTGCVLAYANGIYTVTDSVGSVVCEFMPDTPTVDAVPVLHGRWEQIHYEGGILDGTNVDKCTACGFERVVMMQSIKTKYLFCPICGAKMDMK